MRFEYQAIDDMGKVHQGIEEATSLESFLKIMFTKRLYPIDIKKLNKTDLKLAKEMNHLKKLKDKLEGPDEEPELEIPESTVPPQQVNWELLSYTVVVLVISGSAIASYLIQ